MNFSDNIFFVSRPKPTTTFQELKNEFILSIQGKKLIPFGRGGESYTRKPP